MKRVRQRNYKLGDCGIACVATIIGMEYKPVKRAFVELGILREDGPFYTGHYDLIRVLKHFDFTTTMKEFVSWDDMEGNAIVKVNPYKPYYWHWVVYHRVDTKSGLILDPRPRYKEPLSSFKKHKGAGNYILVEKNDNQFSDKQ